MPRTTILVDLDGVLYDFLGAALDRLKYRWNIRLRPEQILSANVSTWPIPEEAARDLVAQVRDPLFYARIRAYDDAVDPVHQMAGFAHLVAATSRPPASRAVTVEALSRDFRHCLSPHVYMGGRTPKWKVAKLVRARMAIEDNLEEALNHIRHGVRVCLIRRPYTPEVPRVPFLKVVDTLAEAATHCEQLYGCGEAANAGQA